LPGAFDQVTMRIAIIETQTWGGLLHYAGQLGDALAKRGNTVDLIAPHGNELEGRLEAAQMHATLVPAASSTAAPADQGRARTLIRRIGVGLRLGRAWLGALWTVIRGDYDVALISAGIQYEPAAAGTLAMTTLPRRPTVAHVCHNARPFPRRPGEEPRLSPLTHAFLRLAYPRLDRIFVHGERSRQEFEDTWPAANLEVIPHGDERLFGGDPPPPADEERILFFGIWRRSKGIPVLMEAFDDLVGRRPTVRLTIAGMPFPDDVDVDAIRRWAEGHGDKVTLIDRYLEIEEVPDVFAKARVVTTPYLIGYQSGVTHLGMTMARAVVSSDVGDLGSAVIDGETGFLVGPGDATQLAAALERVLSDAALAAELGAEGRRRLLAGAGWEQVAERVEASLARAMAARTSA
jgi:glycosyltransferase involved in cell wall biosynthesis